MFSIPYTAEMKYMYTCIMKSKVENAGVVLQTFPLADLPPGRSATLQTSPPPRKICNVADLPPEDLQHCRPSPKGEGLQHCRSSPFHCRSSPGEDLQHCRPSPIFVKFRILIFGCIEKRVLIIIKDCTYKIC